MLRVHQRNAFLQRDIVKGRDFLCRITPKQMTSIRAEIEIR